MLKICALNESSSDTESDSDQNQVETREAQEAHLLDLYNSALQHLVHNNNGAAKKNLLEITNSAAFLLEEGGSEQIQKTLRYNVHKNLGECFTKDKEYELAQDHFFEASQIDRTDVTLWFSLAAVSVKLEHYYMVRGALVEGLKCSPNHWPCLENLITVSFKLCDNLGCLEYCGMALERDPENKKAKLYKSKVYNEMPYLQEATGDTDFVVQPTEMETFYYKPPPEPPRVRLQGRLTELSWVGLGNCLVDIYQTYRYTTDIINFVDTESLVRDFRTRQQEAEENKIRVSVQNLVEEMIDIIEDEEQEEEINMFCENIVDDLLCDMFGVQRPSESERMVRRLLLEMVGESVEQAPSGRKKGVILEVKARGEKKKFSIFDEVPDELIEKRRSSRKTQLASSQPTSLATSAETSQDPLGGGLRASSLSPAEMLIGLLPSSLQDQQVLRAGTQTKSSHGRTSAQSTPCSAKKALFSLTEPIPWMSEEVEEAQVVSFLSVYSEGSIWDLMRHYLAKIYSLDPAMNWSRQLTKVVGRLYTAWRNAWGNELDHLNPEEPYTREFLRYYILGNECILAEDVEKEHGGQRDSGEEEDELNWEQRLEEDVRTNLKKDMLELLTLVNSLPVDLAIRVRSLRFHYFCLLGDEEEEVSWETVYLGELFEQWPEVVIPHPVPGYKVATEQFLAVYTNNLRKSKELEELNQYYNDGRYEDIVSLLSDTLDNGGGAQFTPAKEAARAPDRETQVDIFIESLFNVKEYARCLQWIEVGLFENFCQSTKDPDTGSQRAPLKAEWDTLDTYITTLESCLQGLVQEQGQDMADSFGDLPPRHAARLAQTLIKIIAFQTEDLTSPELCYTSSLPWILLHKLVRWQEGTSETDQEEMPDSLAILAAAHDFLGQKAACNLEQGRLLNYQVDILLPLLTCKEQLPDYEEQLRRQLEQAVYCLYAHPSKKSRSRHLVDHNVSQAGLTWDRALVLYNYVKPSKLPEHDDVKTLSVSADTENLLKRIVALVPDNLNIEKRKNIAVGFLTGKTSRMKKLSKMKTLPDDAKDLFYLLADYTFKSNSEMDRAIEYYAIDLSFNRGRFDTWAGLALGQASKMDHKLSSCKLLNPQTMLAEIGSVEMCFKECLKINDKNSNLWIEFGNFSYSVHSFISRTLQNNSENLNFEIFEALERRKEEFLSLALTNYQKTLQIFERDGISDNDVDERWLLLFMIGKIKEKQGIDLGTCLDSYLQSILYLRNNEIILPKKINYNNPQDFAIEALEVYYRIHASILKTVAKAEKDNVVLDTSDCQRYYEVMRRAQLDEIYSTNGPTDKQERFSNKRKQGDSRGSSEEPASKVSRQDETSTTIMRDVLEVVDTMIDDIEFVSDTSRYSMENIAKLALAALDDVVFHFFHHFKALYRMAHYFNTSPVAKDETRARQLLLAGLTDKTAPHPGLFGGRKPNMIFNEVWRIPVTEIDRPGSFAHHCSKSMLLLLDVLKNISDVSSLVDISLQLRKAPSEENKFLQENDRREIVTVAATYLNTALKQMVAKVNLEKERRKPVEMLELYKLYQRLQKVWVGKEKEVLLHLKELYLKVKGREADKEKVTDQEVVKFCALEASKARAMANPKPGVGHTVGQAGAAPIGVQAAGASRGTVQQQPAKVVTTGGDTKDGSSGYNSAWQQWGQVLADQQRMMQFQQLMAMAPALPNMTAKDMAAFCGLTDSDLAGLSSYVQGVSSLSCQQLASMGITSSQLSSLAQIASLTKTSSGTITTQAKKQAQFEQDYLRKLMSGTTSSNTTPSSVTTASQAKLSTAGVGGPTVKKTGTVTSTKLPAAGTKLPVAGTKLPYTKLPATGTKQPAAGIKQTGIPGAKQTVNFKAKSAVNPGAPGATKKSVQQMLKEIRAGTNPGNLVSTGNTATSSSTANINNMGNITSVAQKLSTGGVTLTKPVPTQQPAKNTPSAPVRNTPAAQIRKTTPSTQARNTPSPALTRPSLPQGVSITKQPANPGINKKFPHLNISNVDQIKVQKTAAATTTSPKPGISVKPPSTLLKPAAAAAAAASQANQTAVKTGGQAAIKTMDAKNKLALFKAQMKKTLNIPGAQKKSSPVPGGAGPSKQAAQRQTVSGASAKGGAAGKGAGGQGKQAAAGTVKKKAQPKPASSEVICIDID